MSSITSVSRVEIEGGINIFYRQAKPASSSSSSPTILLLHGFPSSSHQFRNLMPLLASKGYNCIAPDLPGFGFTTIPSSSSYKNTFANLATSIESFVSALGLSRFAIYIFDYGAPTGLRLALKQPSRVAAIVSQNGNAYDAGLGADFWAPIQQYWASGSASDRDALRGLLTLETTRFQYENGNPRADKVQPEAYTVDQALMDRPGNVDVQLDLFGDYGSNVKLYPQFQAYLRESDVPVLAMWGKNDVIFVEPGAEAFRKDVKKLVVRPVDTGHFAIETNEQLFADEMDAFFKKFDVFKA